LELLVWFRWRRLPSTDDRRPTTDDRPRRFFIDLHLLTATIKFVLSIAVLVFHLFHSWTEDGDTTSSARIAPLTLLPPLTTDAPHRAS
jgi:hypothetical protein